MSSRETVETAVFRVGYVAMGLAMILPLVIVVGSSVTKAGYLTFPPEQISFTWYEQFLASEKWMTAFKNSAITAGGAMLLSTVLGVSAALGLEGASDRASQYLVPLILIPLLVPAVVLAITLLIMLSRLQLQQSYIGIILAHSLWATPLVFFIMQAVFSRFDWQLRDAATDLGASPLRAFFEVVLPSIKNGLVAAALVAFIISLQEFIMALFLSGQDTRTVPVVAYVALREVLNPVVSVVSTVLVLLVIVLLIPPVAMLGLERLAKQL